MSWCWALPSGGAGGSSIVEDGIAGQREQLSLALQKQYAATPGQQGRRGTARAEDEGEKRRGTSRQGRLRLSLLLSRISPRSVVEKSGSNALVVTRMAGGNDAVLPASLHPLVTRKVMLPWLVLEMKHCSVQMGGSVYI